MREPDWRARKHRWHVAMANLHCGMKLLVDAHKAMRRYDSSQYESMEHLRAHLSHIINMVQTEKP